MQETTDKIIIDSSNANLRSTNNSHRIRKNIFKGEDISEERHYRAEYISKLPKESIDW